MVVAGKTNVNIGFKETLEMLLDKGLIYNDLTQFSQIMTVIQRNDIVEKLQVYQELSFEWKKENSNPNSKEK